MSSVVSHMFLDLPSDVDIELVHKRLTDLGVTPVGRTKPSNVTPGRLAQWFDVREDDEGEVLRALKADGYDYYNMADLMSRSTARAPTASSGGSGTSAPPRAAPVVKAPLPWQNPPRPPHPAGRSGQRVQAPPARSGRVAHRGPAPTQEVPLVQEAPSTQVLDVQPVEDMDNGTEQRAAAVQPWTAEDVVPGLTDLESAVQVLRERLPQQRHSLTSTRLSLGRMGVIIISREVDGEVDAFTTTWHRDAIGEIEGEVLAERVQWGDVVAVIETKIEDLAGLLIDMGMTGLTDEVT